MQLTCPNCQARYAISDDLIPEAGRDVQCSNCAHTWFQVYEPAGMAAPRPELSQAVRSILSEEAEREQRARAMAPPVVPQPEPRPAGAAASAARDETALAAESLEEDDLDYAEPSAASGFLGGFVGIILVCGVAAGLYLGAPAIAEQVPAASAALSAYINLVDTALVGLSGAVAALRAALGV